MRADSHSGPPAADDRRRTLAEQELVGSLGWMVAMRWFIGPGVVLGSLAASRVLRLPVPELPLVCVGLFILAYNAGLWWWLVRHGGSHADATEPYALFARVQMALDWLVITVLIALTGGVESPAIIFFLFHISIAGLLLPHERVFLSVALAPVMVTLVAVLEYVGVLPHVALFGAPRHDQPLYALTVIVCFTAACFMLAYICVAIARRLRRREKEIGGLYDSVRETTSTLDLRDRAEPPRRIDHARPRLQGRGDPADRPQAQAGGVRGHLRVERRVRGEGAAGLQPRPPRPGDAGGRTAVRERRRRRPAHLEPEAGARGRDRVDAVGAAGGQDRPARRPARVRRRRAPLQRRGRGVPRTRRGARRGGDRERAGVPDARGTRPGEVAVRPDCHARAAFAHQRDREPAHGPGGRLRGRTRPVPRRGHPAGAQAGAGAADAGERPARPRVGQGRDEGGRAAARGAAARSLPRCATGCRRGRRPKGSTWRSTARPTTWRSWRTRPTSTDAHQPRRQRGQVHAQGLGAGDAVARVGPGEARRGRHGHRHPRRRACPSCSRSSTGRRTRRRWRRPGPASGWRS